MRKIEPCLVKLTLREISGRRIVVLGPHSRHSSSGSLAAGIQECASSAPLSHEQCLLSAQEVRREVAHPGRDRTAQEEGERAPGHAERWHALVRLT